jgi:isoquinoline 1-oxidoreductase beta subunit
MRDFRLIGKNLPRVEMLSKVDGSAKFGIDAAVPDMLIATVLRAPVQGSSPDSVDDTAARAVPGITAVVPLPYGVGVVGTSFPAVQRGMRALKVTWKSGGSAAQYSSDRIMADYEAIARDLGRAGLPVHTAGTISDAMSAAARIYESVYLTDHVYHATMEPMNALARVSASGDSAEIWLGTQAPSLTQFAAAGALKTTPDKITVNTQMLGGGFGRRVEQDYTVDAVLLSKATGKPVKVIWTREEDVKHDKYRPLTAHLLRAAVDKDGTVSAWRHRVVAASFYARFNPRALEAAKGVDATVTEGMEMSYAIPAQKMEYLREERGRDVGVWRSVGPGFNKFAMESFIDEIARKQKVDPVAFRLRMLKENPRATTVVETAARMGGWKRARKNGRAVGFAFSDAWKSYIATMVEISLDDKTGTIGVHEVWSAVDPGVAILPDNVTAQVEGAAVFGVSHALAERITLKDGVPQQSNFSDYPLLRFADTPDVHVQVISTDNAPGGIGEVGLPPIAPAIGNAVAALVGVRLRQLPMSPDRVLAALKTTKTEARRA